MINFKHIKITALAVIALATAISFTNISETAFAQPTTSPAAVQNSEISVTPLALVNAPQNYLNKNIVMKAKFDKFSTIGLDYKPAMRSSEDYISFLIKRDDTTHNIPLSELKLFLKRDLAEKFIDLKTDDEIEIKGKVFSTALGDAWVDTDKLTVTKKAVENKDGAK